MRQETINELAKDLWNNVFQTLDGYFLAHEMSAEDAGRIATLTEQTFRDALEKHGLQTKEERRE
jgi:hypothetical protein